MARAAGRMVVGSKLSCGDDPRSEPYVAAPSDSIVGSTQLIPKVSSIPLPLIPLAKW